jgi:hypothetical protein
MALKDQLLTDLTSVFFNTDEFATSATFTRGTTAPATINVILDKGYQATEGAENYAITALCKTSDVVAAKAGDTLVIGSITYKVLGPAEHTADGTSLLYLTED